MAQIAVMGAGIFGLSAAWELARRGASVTVCDPNGVGAGASGGVVGALAPHVPENWNPKKAFQLDSLLMAEGFWAEIRAQSGIDPGYARLGRVQPLADSVAVERAHERAANARELWRGQAEWRVLRAAQTPGLSFESASGWAVFDTLSARISPRGALAALEGALRRTGARFEAQGTPPEAADAVLWATGAEGLKDLGAALGMPMGTAVKGQAGLLAADLRAAPQLFIEGLHIVPHADGTVAIGSTTERNFADPGQTDAQLETIIGRVRALCPELAQAPVLERWAGLRPRSPSRAPMLGEWPGRPGHYVLNGGFKIGFGMAPKLAEVIAELILEGQDRIPAGFRVTDNMAAAGC